MKDLVKENGNQATIGSIPRLFIPDSLRQKMLEDEATWRDLKAANITPEELRSFVSRGIVPRLVVEEITGGFTNHIVGAGVGALFGMDETRAYGLETYAGQAIPNRSKAYLFRWDEGDVPYLYLEEA